jgi:hypothetical protein
MRSFRITLAVAVVFVMLTGAVSPAPFVVFPAAGELLSPNGKFVVRNAEEKHRTSEIVGSVRSLWLLEVATGRSRKLCNYLGVAAVAWSGNDFVMVTEYVGKRTSRAWVFPVDAQGETILLDQPSLTRLAPPEFRDTLRQSDHVFVEAAKLESNILFFRVWGYGNYNPAFHLKCEYALVEERIACGRIP